MISQKKGPETKKCVHFLGLANSQPFPLWKKKKKGKNKTTILIFHQNILKCLAFSKKHTKSSGNFSSNLRVIFLSGNVKLNESRVPKTEASNKFYLPFPRKIKGEEQCERKLVSNNTWKLLPKILGSARSSLPVKHLRRYLWYTC